ncbi:MULTISPECIES: helix-turn-helix domain-containing protein [unclassified Aureimonas]|uniref:helix-turn-helix domain-containing protein n=1 Tax=unclassified Aureimonas TaxID=2615206 RepID=UPI0006F360F3|nr:MULTISPECIES: helix-turn-helix transcriptional regulator [unclassified Aureimonas]KQT61839.1 XRE family transcriptional regulator [Aureimonas sp. Leaf427]KQT74871.1 XRE family transcriptional regulator [Aureimonas sp. Leaf460]
MNRQIITTPAGERLVILAEADFEALLDAAEDAADAAAVHEFRRRFAAGEEELVPAAVVDRILGGENKVRVWREHRGLTIAVLAEAAGLSQPFVSQIETGKRKAKPETLASLAKVLRVDIEDLRQA